VEQRIIKLEDRVTVLELRNAADEVHHTNVESRLGGIEDTLKWLVRLIIGSLLIGLMGFIIRGGFIPV